MFILSVRCGFSGELCKTAGLLFAAFQNALVNLDIEKNYKTALADLGFNLEQLYEFEHDPALGNGGLGESTLTKESRPYTSYVGGGQRAFGIF